MNNITTKLTTNDALIEGRWYWVRRDNDIGWFPMLRDKSSVGGWTNTDTAEDWDKSIIEWKLIPLPEELS